MVLAKKLKALVSVADGGVQRVARAGAWPAVYPTIIGVALAAASLDLWPNLGPALHRKYGAIGLTVLGVLLLHGITVIIALCIRRKVGGFDLLGAAQALWRRAAFLASLPLVVELGRPLERTHPFLALSYAAVIGLLCGYTVYYAQAPRRIATWWQRQHTRRWPQVVALTILGGMWVAYSVAISRIAIFNHLSFNTGRIDLGWYVNIVRRSSIGDPLGCSLCSSGTHINAHFDPILVLISPLFWFYPQAEMLLALQAVWLGSGVIPLYLIARHQSLDRFVALALCACYCLYPALHGINLFDFHSLALLVPIALWLWLCFEKGWVKRYFAVLVLLLLVREDVALLSLCLGMAFLISGRPNAFKLGATTIALAAGYFLLVKGVIMPNSDLLNKKQGAGGYAHFYQELLPKGSKGTTAGVLTTLISNPTRLLELAFQEDKLRYFAHLFVPVLAVPFLAAWGKFALAYGLAFTLLATREPVHSIHFHYSSILVPVVFALAASGLATLNGHHWLKGSPAGLRRGVVSAMLVTSICLSLKFGGLVPNASFKGGFSRLERNPTPAQRERSQWLQELCARLPKDAKVTAPSHLMPHMGRCRNLVNFNKPEKAEYIVWPRGVLKGPTTSKWGKRIHAEYKQGVYKEVESDRGLVLFLNTQFNGK